MKWIRLGFALLPWMLTATVSNGQSGKLKPTVNKAGGKEAASEDVLLQLKEFYSTYIIENAAREVDELKVKRLLAQNCTKSFLARTKKLQAEGKLDWDPLVDAQDYERASAGTVKVKELEKRAKYEVCYTISFENQTTCLLVFMKSEDGSWKINHVEPVVK